MQIDGHHTLTYVVARLAGLDHADADIVAYSAQYVDDATNEGTIKFDNGAMYNRTSSAHKTLDYRNSDALANRHVWVAFHFLPGNGGLPAGKNPGGSFIEKLVCFPDSPPARDMLKSVMLDIDKPYALHRLGIAMHVYADTFAHQGFAGVNHPINEVNGLSSSDSEKDDGFFAKIANFFLTKAYPLGHGAALSFPDTPFVSWKYTNGLNQPVVRNNHQIFCEAADAMCRAIQCYIAGDKTMDLASQPGLPESDKTQISKLLGDIRHEKGDDRHAEWIKTIAAGQFSFGPVQLSFIPKGIGSWKHQAIGQDQAEDNEDDKFNYHPDFLSSNWKCFHDALQAHRFAVIHDILPKYGICVA